MIATASAGPTILVLASVAATFLLLLVVERRFLTPRALLTPEDQLTTSGRPVTLRIQVERDIALFWDPPLPGAEIRIFEEEAAQPFATVKTDAQGLAHLALPAYETPGRRRFRAALAGPLKADDAPFLVDVLPQGRPVLIVDIDGTVADVNQVMHAFRANDRIRVKPGAPEALAALASSHAVAFLTARDHVFRARTLAWLRDNGFGESPVLMRRRRVWSQRAIDHKRERLAELAPHVTLAAGVGDLPSDATVYRERGMKTFLIGLARSRESTSARDWPAVLRELSQV